MTNFANSAWFCWWLLF